MNKEIFYKMKAEIDLGSKIYSNRVVKDMSQEELAQKCSLDLETIKNIEEKGKIHSIETLYCILDALSLEIELKEKDIFC